MASAQLIQVDKIYPDGTEAIRNLSLEVMDGELLVLVGPSGCGKSTVLRLLAGLEDVSGGDILIDGKRINNLSPQERNIAMVFQNYALYPHMSVRKNMEFPLQMMRFGKNKRKQLIKKTADLLKLTDLLEKKPASLSGGQRQRVAMARALVRNPTILLMDEPLSNLDAKLRVQIRGEIADLQCQARRTTIYVTHDQIEAMTLGDRVAVLHKGILQQIAPPEKLYTMPSNTFVAGFLGSPGMNIFETSLTARGHGSVAAAFGDHWLTLSDEILGKYNTLIDFLDKPIMAGIRPESIVCENFSTNQQQIPITVTAFENLGHDALVYFTVLQKNDSKENVPTDMVLRWRSSQCPAVHERLTICIPTSELYFFDQGGNIIF